MIKSYIRASRNPFYSFILVIPLFILYEILITLINYNLPFQVRNGADVLIRRLLFFSGEYSEFILIGILLICSSLFWWKGSKLIKDDGLEYQIPIIMILESLVYAVVIYLSFIKLPEILIIGDETVSIIQTLTLAIGAGIFEEILFRLILFAGTMVLLTKIFKIDKTGAFLTALVFSSVLFSLFHYLGSFGDPFIWRSFLQRSLAGGILCGIYFFRGFGICAFCHVFYNFIVIHFNI